MQTSLTVILTQNMYCKAEGLNTAGNLMSYFILILLKGGPTPFCDRCSVEPFVLLDKQTQRISFIIIIPLCDSGPKPQSFFFFAINKHGDSARSRDTPKSFNIIAALFGQFHN
jgi:hypothetical protein